MRVLIMCLFLVISSVGCDGRIEDDKLGVPLVEEQVNGKRIGSIRNAEYSNIVKKVQEELRERGFSEGQTSGIVDPETAGALENFQREKNLKVTGNINQETLEALGIDPKEEFSE